MTVLQRIKAAMSDEKWHSLAWIAAATKLKEVTASARLRELRSRGSIVDTQRMGGGKYAYRLTAEGHLGFDRIEHRPRCHQCGRIKRQGFASC